MQHEHGKVKKTDKRKAIILSVIVVIVMALCLGVLYLWENKHYDTGASGNGGGIEEPILKTVEYNGDTYQQRDELETWLFMGVDVMEKVSNTDTFIDGGQADMQLLITVDNKNQTWQMLQLNRDSMIEVPVLGMTGEEVGTEFEQLALAHSYGNGGKESCKNDVKAVSNMFDGQKINGYLALNMEGLNILNDMVGGVPVVVNDDFTMLDPTLVQGQEVVLQGSQALTFVRERQNVGDETNVARMARQREYMNSLKQKLKEQDEEFGIRAYDALSEYTVTNMGSGNITNLLQCLKDYQERDLLTIDGESRIENDTNAYYLNEDSLKQVMLEMFYEKVN